ncbi:hypothetical protein D187_007755 [Cystobacter fuscus DSM 2262]|uniref:Lipoprotein n=1 Tax=Cystobacter fuscus (strain ATCC 25194 / DSM 2262 / NBRC 100088 / M29) TaxID=1242864 RepID=S9QIW7_CYSF2|nr:hypothetical protein [Cystobacter fuscus]EPX56413.1 hypothetical protein D187_007755 [Cystobacter fuscus DSM 2262]
MSKKFLVSVGFLVSACQEAPLAHEPQENTRLSQALTSQGTTVQGTFYDFEVMGMTGSGQVHAASLYPVFTGVPSINDQGRVAFVAAKINDGDSIFLDNGSTPLNTTGSVYTDFGYYPRINAAGHVLSSESNLGGMGVRLWTGQDTATTITYSDGSSGFYGFEPFVALNDSDQTAFSGEYLQDAASIVATRNAATANAPIYRRNTLSRADAIAMDNTGNVVYVHETDNGPALVLSSNNLSSTTVIADTACFWNIGHYAGISPDGRIIVFYGESNGACAIQPAAESAVGVFASLDIGGSTRKLVRLSGVKVEDLTSTQGNQDGTCDAGETCRSGELGFDPQGNPFTFASFNTNSRIGVAHQQLGASGLAEDSFVVSIVGKPNAAHHQGRFSAQPGIWTVRADVSLTGSAFKLNLATPIPVIQIGDSIGSEVVAQLGPSPSHEYIDPDIANARVAYSGTPRQQAGGDHRVAFYAKTTTGQELVVRGEHLE